MSLKLTIPDFSPENTVFLLLSFEGPDVYSQAGGLGVRMAELSRALAEAGHETHLFFVGDPAEPAVEKKIDGRLVYHRWCQWISGYHPGGVYDGEEGKRLDYRDSLPPWINDNFFLSSAYARKQIVVLAEEWHTVEAVIALSRLAGVSRPDLPVLFLWNANNTFGFHRIDWGVLERACVVTTVSKYMKHLMWGSGINPLVIPNGIPERWFGSINPQDVEGLRTSAAARPLLAKVGRFDPDKRWLMAIQGMAVLKRLGFRPKLIMRGGMEPHGHEVRLTAWNLGLKMATIKLPKGSPLGDFFKAVRAQEDVDILDLQFFVPEETLRLIYRSADAVLANSRHEPFGLVGLEVMASNGVAITGNTGEDYALDFDNGIVVETDDPLELSSSLAHLSAHPDLGDKLRNAGYESARAFRWDRVIEELKRKLAYVSLAQSL